MPSSGLSTKHEFNHWVPNPHLQCTQHNATNNPAPARPPHLRALLARQQHLQRLPRPHANPLVWCPLRRRSRRLDAPPRLPPVAPRAAPHTVTPPRRLYPHHPRQRAARAPPRQPPAHRALQRERRSGTAPLLLAPGALQRYRSAAGAPEVQPGAQERQVGGYDGTGADAGGQVGAEAMGTPGLFWGSSGKGGAWGGEGMGVEVGERAGVGVGVDGRAMLCAVWGWGWRYLNRMEGRKEA